MFERHLRVKVREQCAMILTGEGQRLMMSGGATTRLDLVLYLVARSVGVEAAMQAARVNLIDWHSIGQQPFARLARTRQVAYAVIAHGQKLVAEHHQELDPVTALGRLSGLAQRLFKGCFRNATSMSPLEYVHAPRIEEAKRMLEASEEPIELIEVGYEDSALFSGLFRRQVNLGPAQYRRRFGAAS
jgi:transcriptional regulator GlxA family with amidase domain